MFDGVIVTFSLIDMLLSSVNGSASIFRLVRILRVMRSLERVPIMRQITSKLITVSQGLFYMAILMLLFIFVFAVLGMQVFAGRFTPAMEQACWWWVVEGGGGGIDWTYLLATLSGQLTHARAHDSHHWPLPIPATTPRRCRSVMVTSSGRSWRRSAA